MVSGTSSLPITPARCDSCNDCRSLPLKSHVDWVYMMRSVVTEPQVWISLSPNGLVTHISCPGLEGTCHRYHRNVSDCVLPDSLSQLMPCGLPAQLPDWTLQQRLEYSCSEDSFHKDDLRSVTGGVAGGAPSVTLIARITAWPSLDVELLALSSAMHSTPPPPVGDARFRSPSTFYWPKLHD